MSSDYRAAAGFDVALGSLTVLSPQPRSPGVKAADRSYALDGSVYEQGDWVALIWDHFADGDQYVAALAFFGLDDTTLSAEVTVYIRNANYDYQRANGVAIHPRLGVDGEWREYLARNFVIIVNELEWLGEP